MNRDKPCSVGLPHPLILNEPVPRLARRSSGSMRSVILPAEDVRHVGRVGPGRARRARSVTLGIGRGTERPKSKNGAHTSGAPPGRCSMRPNATRPETSGRWSAMPLGAAANAQPANHEPRLSPATAVRSTDVAVRARQRGAWSCRMRPIAPVLWSAMPCGGKGGRLRQDVRESGLRQRSLHPVVGGAL